MGAAKLIFSTSSLPLAGIIRAKTYCPWSHVTLVDELAGEVIEAVMPRVRIVSLDEFLAKHPRHLSAWLPARDSAAVIEVARSQEGKPYDWKGAIGLGVNRDWQDPSAWFCSELVAWAFQEAGSPLFRAEALRRVTPQHLWMLAPSSDFNNQQGALYA